MHESLFQEHDGLAIHWAKKHRGSGVDIQDLIQDARIGLLLAATKYDGDRGIRFSTYASYWIRNALQRGTLNLVGTLSASEEARIQSRWLQRGVGEAVDELDTPSLHDAAEQLALSEDAVEALLRVGQVAAAIDPTGSQPEQRTIPSTEPNPPDVVEQQLERERVRRAIAAMPPEEAAVVRHRFGFFGDPASREMVQKATGIPSRRQREVERSALKHLRVILVGAGAVPTPDAEPAGVD